MPFPLSEQVIIVSKMASVSIPAALQASGSVEISAVNIRLRRGSTATSLAPVRVFNAVPSTLFSAAAELANTILAFSDC
jgi:hypothetical protein